MTLPADARTAGPSGRAVVSAPGRGAGGGRCRGRRTRVAPTAAAGIRRPASGQAAPAEWSPPIAPRRRWPVVPVPACAVAGSLGGEDRVERGGELTVPIADEKPELADAVVEGHGQVAGLLRHPRSCWMRGDPEHVDPAAGHLEHEQDLQPAQQDRVHGEEVDGQHAVGLGAEELPPGDRRPHRCGIDACPVEDGPHGAGPDPVLVPEAAQLAVDAAISQVGFSLASRTTNARSSAAMVGRPRRCG